MEGEEPFVLSTDVLAYFEGTYIWCNNYRVQLGWCACICSRSNPTVDICRCAFFPALILRYFQHHVLNLVLNFPLDVSDGESFC